MRDVARRVYHVTNLALVREVTATAAVFFHRCMAAQERAPRDVLLAALASLFLAGKATDHPIWLKPLLRACEALGPALVFCEQCRCAHAIPCAFQPHRAL